MRTTAAALVALLALATLAGCASTDDGAAAMPDVVENEPATSSVNASAELPRAVGVVEVDDELYRLVVDCYALGAGEVVALGAGEAAESGEMVEMYLQAFLGAPYIGIRLADGTRLEPSLDSPLALYVQDDAIRASSIQFVKDLELETGEGTEVGWGRIEIICPRYSDELPA